jgi:hypothetical protein
MRRNFSSISSVDSHSYGKDFRYVSRDLNCLASSKWSYSSLAAGVAELREASSSSISLRWISVSGITLSYTLRERVSPYARLVWDLPGDRDLKMAYVITDNLSPLSLTINQSSITEILASVHACFENEL